MIEDIILKHYNYLKSVNFKGWDVLDGLNSKLFQKSPFYRNKNFRLLWIQLCRKSPISFRRITQVPKEYNPKALALFISGLLNLFYHFQEERFLEQALALHEELMQLKSDNYSGLSWGYNFDWQARAFYVPKFKPNMVCSVFAGHAFLDLFETIQDEQYLTNAKSIARFIKENLISVNEKDRTCFAYIPGESAIIHNVNLLGAGFLSRLFYLTGIELYQLLAEKSVRFSVDHQRHDGAWVYGKQRHHQWVDNFHTGYNLVSIYNYQYYCMDKQFEQAIINGVNFHVKNHFTEKVLPKYTDNNLYPLDIHCFAQAIITFLILKDYIPDHKVWLDSIIKNAITVLWDKKVDYFWYKKSRFFIIKIPYIRWAQAWMFYSLSYYLAGENEQKNRNAGLSCG